MVRSMVAGTANRVISENAAEVSRATEAHQAYPRVLDLTITPPLEVYVLLLRTAAAPGREAEAGVFAADYVARGGDRSVIEQRHRQTAGAPPGAPSTGSAVVNP
jgi:hypothetical protein